MTSSVPSGTDQSSRDSPPLVVSPDTPALIDLDIVTLGLERRLQLFGKAFARIEPVSGHQAVAEADDAIGLGGSDRGRDRTGNQRPAKARRLSLKAIDTNPYVTDPAQSSSQYRADFP